MGAIVTYQSREEISNDEIAFATQETAEEIKTLETDLVNTDKEQLVGLDFSSNQPYGSKDGLKPY